MIQRFARFVLTALRAKAPKPGGTLVGLVEMLKACVGCGFPTTGGLYRDERCGLHLQCNRCGMWHAARKGMQA